MHAGVIKAFARNNYYHYDIFFIFFLQIKDFISLTQITTYRLNVWFNL